MMSRMDAYAFAYRSLFFPLWERLRHRPTPARMDYLSRTQFSSTDELCAVQVGALRRLLLHAQDQVPAYRQRMQRAGFDPLSVRDPSDLARLPLLTRQDLQQDPSSFLAQNISGPLLTKSTSGTTGSPFRFHYDLQSEVWRQAVKLRAYGWAGYTPGQRTVHYWGPPAARPKGGKALKIHLDRSLRREIYLDCAMQSEGDLLSVVDILRRLRPKVLVGFTQATVELGRFVIRRGLRDWPAMRVLCGAERLFPENRGILIEAFGQPGSVFETYGCREFMLIGSECEAHDGLHQSMENLLCEVVDDSGAPVPSGTRGQIAITDLNNHGMPFIRYLTGDLGVATDPAARCSCGRGLLRLASLEGRQSDLLRGADGRGIPGIIFNSIFAGMGDKVRQFQAVQKPSGQIDLKVVPGPEFDDSVVDGVRGRLRPYLGDLPLSINLVQTIPTLPSGKRRYVVVEDAQRAL